MRPNIKLIIFLLMLAFVAAIGVLHAVTPGHLILYHDTYRRLSYFPIAIGAVFYGLKGGIALAVLSCLSFVPHLYTFWAEGPEAYYSELSEIIFYMAAGVVIGLISSRENRLREQYKSLSEKLAGSYRRLHHQASQLVAAEKQLGKSQKLSMLGHVSASLAHEIKNPLAAIKGAAEILADEVPEDHPKHEFVDIMRAETSRLNQSVEEVLKYCRGQQHQNGGSRENIETIINRVVVLLESALNEKAIQLSVNVDPEIKGFPTDETAMNQVVMNVVINAIDAVDKKGRIQIELSAHGSGCQIKISDDGHGIVPEKTDEVFHSFVTYKEEGTGLGLSISKRIVESLGGKIGVETSVWGGACFSIQLPENIYSSRERI